MTRTTKTDANTTIQEVKDAFVQFRTERGWTKSATAHNMATSLMVEAAELLEHFQWEDQRTTIAAQADELADVISYCLAFATVQNIDIASALYSKLARIKQKYPLEHVHGGEFDDDTYYAVRRAYRAKG